MREEEKTKMIAEVIKLKKEKNKQQSNRNIVDQQTQNLAL